MGIKDLLVTENQTLAEAVNALEQSPIKLVIVVDENQKLLGTITDGDVRRGLIQGIDLSVAVSTVMSVNCRVLHQGFDRAKSTAALGQTGLKHFPIVDDQGVPVDIFSLDVPFNNGPIPNKVVLMAGGKGTRLGALTKSCPKPMLKVAGTPILEIILGNCIESGFNNFSISVNYLGNQIKDYFGDGRRWGVNIDYLSEEMPLGTAGALSLLKDHLHSPVVVLNGDILTKLNLAGVLEFHSSNNAQLTMCTRQHQVDIPFGVIESEANLIKKISEKPSLSFAVNAGIYVIDHNVINEMEQIKALQMTELFEEAVKQNKRVISCPIYDYWLDVGVPESLMRAKDEW